MNVGDVVTVRGFRPGKPVTGIVTALAGCGCERCGQQDRVTVQTEFGPIWPFASTVGMVEP